MSNDGQTLPPIMILDEFLVAQEWAGLLQYTLDRGSDFMATGVLSGGGVSEINPHYRRSRVIFDLERYNSLFADRLQTFLPIVLRKLGMDWFPVSHVEVQLTASNHGEYFKVHKDNDSDVVGSRAVTFVYYFYREPKAFAGGELCIFGNWSNDGQYEPAGPYHTVQPTQNQVVFFKSDYPHEVLPVDCPSRDLADSRFTVNGWLHR